VSQGVQFTASPEQTAPEELALVDALVDALVLDDVVPLVLDAIDPLVLDDVAPPEPAIIPLDELAVIPLDELAVIPLDELAIPPMPLPEEDDDECPPLPEGPQIPFGQPVVVVVAFPPPPPHMVSDRAPPSPRAARANRVNLRCMLSSC
jgi:hypothetical protein